MVFRRVILTLLTFVLAVAGTATAQTWSSEQQDIWRLEEQQWQMSADKDLSWIEKMVHPSLSFWENDQPAPRNKASLARWSRFESTSTTVLQQEIFPITVTVTGNVAVAQYTYQTVREDYKKERKTVTGRYTDVLVKEGGRWLFIAWSGGDDPKK